MSKNKIIRFAIAVTKVVFVICAINAIAVVILVAHWHLNRAYYDSVYMANGFQAGLNSFNIVFSDRDLTNVSLGDLSSMMMLWMLIRNMTLIALVVMILRKIMQVLRSINGLNTFYDQNIRNFKKISNLGLGLTAIAFFNFQILDDDTMWNFTIPFGPLLFSLSFIVLGEVFKEGKKLVEDSNSIV